MVSLFLATGCASGPPGKVKVIPEKETKAVSTPLPSSPYRVLARFSWSDALVEKVEVPGRVVDGVFYPAHEETVLVSPAGYRVVDVKNGQAVERRASASVYAKGGEKSVLPSLRGEERLLEDEKPVAGEPRVTAVMSGMPLGDALIAVTAPAKFKVRVSPGVNTSLPVTLSVKDKPLGRALALLLGPYGYRAMVDLERKEVRVEIRR